MESNEINPVFDLERFTDEVNNTARVPKIQEIAESCKIDLSKPLTPPPVAMQVKSNDKKITLFTKGNFSIITGKPKSRKTKLIITLMATAIKGSFQDHFFCESKGMNILFDTEQSEHKVQQVANSICRLAEIENPKNFTSYHLRTKDPAERLEIIEHVLKTTPNLNFLAIDGIIDLGIDPILQVEEAQNIISKLMKWTELFNIHIVCVLHYNKTVSTLLGHLGSFAHRKADCIIEVVKDTDSDNISFVNPVDCREMDFVPFAFSIDENGMPNIENEISVIKSKTSSKKEKTERVKAINPNNIDESIHTEILKESFKLFQEQSYSDLWKTLKQEVSRICKDQIKDTIGDNKAKDFVTYYLQNELIVKIEVNRKTMYTIKEQKKIEFTDPV